VTDHEGDSQAPETTSNGSNDNALDPERSGDVAHRDSLVIICSIYTKDTSL